MAAWQESWVAVFCVMDLAGSEMKPMFHLYS